MDIKYSVNPVILRVLVEDITSLHLLGRGLFVSASVVNSVFAFLVKVCKWIWLKLDELKTRLGGASVFLGENL